MVGKSSEVRQRHIIIIVSTTTCKSKKKLHFQFDIQAQPRGWLRFDADGGWGSNQWKHFITQDVVNDAKIMPRVVQLLDARSVAAMTPSQSHGSNIVVREAIKQAKMEKEKGVYTVHFSMQKSSSASSAPISNASMSSRAAN